MSRHTISKFIIIALLPLITLAQTVQVGLGSYRTSIPSGEVGPPVSPKVSATFDQNYQTNDFWSSLIFPFGGDANRSHSNMIYAHPLTYRAVSDGLELVYLTDYTLQGHAHGQDVLYAWHQHAKLKVGVSGLSVSRTLTEGYGDWTVTALWDDGPITMEATIGHGLPFAYLLIEGGDAVVSGDEALTVWHQQDEVLGLTLQGRHYALFAPTGSNWTGSGTFQSSLNGKGYLSVALLPDTETATLELFRSHAYAFVTDSRVTWDYDESSSKLLNTYAYETTLMDSAAGNLDETLTALYRHQWLNSFDPMTAHSYVSPRGEMKLLAGNSFTTELTFNGIIPAMPNLGDYNPDVLLSYLQEAAQETLPINSTYWNGKAMARFAHMVRIADQLGAETERDHFIAQIKTRLEDWFTAGGEQEYAYNANWDVLTGYPSGFGADDQINDHHFHAAYAIMSAAVVAQFDSAWAAQDNWGGMVNMLIRDANSWDRNDPLFPFLRSFDAYAGHSWAAGHAAFAEGNNQESSSESMNFATAAFLWGEVTGQDHIRDLGVYLHTTEITAVEQYWFDIDDAVFPAEYPHLAIGMVWGGKNVHATWFGGDPEFIHGINLLPITSGSLYLGHHPEYVLANYEEIVTERSGQPTKWKDLFWRYLALSDPNLALSYYYADPGDDPTDFDDYFDGESKANTLHWLYNLKKMGHVETSIVSDIATYSVFKDLNNDLTYIAYNADPVERTVKFSDGFTMNVPPKEMVTYSTASEIPGAPVALLLANKTSGKSPLSVDFIGSTSFDRLGSSLTYHWDFGDGTTADVADVEHVFTEVGDYNVVLSVTNELALTTKDSVQITVLGNGTPFSGTPFRVPGRIQAEDYDNGGEGVAYHDVDANNAGLAYRPDEGVDIIGVGGGYAVYWIVAGEWIEYTFEVQQDGYYNFIPYAATVPGFGNFTLYIDNVDVSGEVAVPHTGGFEFWMPFEVPAVQLDAGVHIMRLEFDSDTDKAGWLFSLNYIDVTQAVSVDPEHIAELPTEFQLKQNYPNPFNPSTTLSYELPSRSDVTLSVFDVSGRLIRTLRQAEQPAGAYRVQWDGLDASGNPVGTGVYFCHLIAGDFEQTIKMLYLK